MSFILQLLDRVLCQCRLKVIPIILVIVVQPEISIGVGIFEVDLKPRIPK
tara:strand:- start:185 stop:334 length:150 start_codon:yes stop_codon:yes gene_type:complete